MGLECSRHVNKASRRSWPPRAIMASGYTRIATREPRSVWRLCRNAPPPPEAAWNPPAGRSALQLGEVGLMTPGAAEATPDTPLAAPNWINGAAPIASGLLPVFLRSAAFCGESPVRSRLSRRFSRRLSTNPAARFSSAIANPQASTVAAVIRIGGFTGGSPLLPMQASTDAGPATSTHGVGCHNPRFRFSEPCGSRSTQRDRVAAVAEAMGVSARSLPTHRGAAIARQSSPARRRCGASHIGPSNEQRPRRGDGGADHHWNARGGTLTRREDGLRGALRNLRRNVLARRLGTYAAVACRT